MGEIIEDNREENISFSRRSLLTVRRFGGESPHSNRRDFEKQQT